MLVNDGRDHPSHVEFISYTGRWPSLCCGILTLRIDGETATFGSQERFADKLPDGSAPAYPKFWESGGEAPRSGQILAGEWKIDVSCLPEKYRKYAEEIDAVFNKHVEHGCCGGCR